MTTRRILKPRIEGLAPWRHGLLLPPIMLLLPPMTLHREEPALPMGHGMPPPLLLDNATMLDLVHSGMSGPLPRLLLNGTHEA
jgi:hypothetical protein